MSLQDEPHIIVTASLVRSTGKAWLLLLEENGEEIWLPKTQGEWVAADTWRISKWIAEQKGIL